MVTRIDELTPEQEAQMKPWADKWIKIGLCCDPADRHRAEDAYRRCYEFSELNSKVPVRWVLSPKAGAQAAGMARDYIEAGEERAEYAVERAIDEVLQGRAKKTSWHYWLGGQLWAAWPAMSTFFTEVCGLELPGDLNARCQAYADCSRYAGYWWPNEHFIIACDRPNFIKRDPEGRLHAEDGHAIQYRDNWGVAAWHGVVIPEEWLKGELDAQTAITWDNIEQRRAACEILGWAQVLDTLGAKVINEDPDPEIGTLVEVDLPDSGRERFLKVRCGTGRTFALPVPGEMKSALEANAWTYDIDPKVFKPEVRT